MSQMKRPILMSHFNVTDEKAYFDVTLLCHKCSQNKYTINKGTTPLKCTFLAEMHMHQITLPKPLSPKEKIF